MKPPWCSLHRETMVTTISVDSGQAAHICWLLHHGDINSKTLNRTFSSRLLIVTRLFRRHHISEESFNVGLHRICWRTALSLSTSELTITTQNKMKYYGKDFKWSTADFFFQTTGCRVAFNDLRTNEFFFSLLVTQCFPTIEKLFWQSVFSLLYSRGRCYKSTEIIQHLQIQKHANTICEIGMGDMTKISYR